MPQDIKEFDFNSTIKPLQEGKPLHGQEGILTP